MSRLLLAFVTIGLLFLGCLRLLSPSAEAGNKPASAGPFSDKPVLVQAKDQVAYTLVKVEVRQLGGRSFLVGREMRNSPYMITKEQWKGAMVWVPLDTVTQMVELEPVKPEK